MLTQSVTFHRGGTRAHTQAKGSGALTDVRRSHCVKETRWKGCCCCCGSNSDGSPGGGWGWSTGMDYLIRIGLAGVFVAKGRSSSSSMIGNLHGPPPFSFVLP